MPRCTDPPTQRLPAPTVRHLRPQKLSGCEEVPLSAFRRQAPRESPIRTVARKGNIYCTDPKQQMARTRGGTPIFRRWNGSVLYTRLCVLLIPLPALAQQLLRKEVRVYREARGGATISHGQDTQGPARVRQPHNTGGKLPAPNQNVRKPTVAGASFATKVNRSLVIKQVAAELRATSFGTVRLCRALLAAELPPVRIALQCAASK